MESEEPVTSSESPMMRAGRAEAALATPEGRDRMAEHEADIVVKDIDSYVAETDPSSLANAEKELNAWDIPSDPLDAGSNQPAVGPNEELVGVFSAGSEMEANIVRGLLESEGIPVMTALNGTAYYGGILTLGGGSWGSLLVPPSQADSARAIIAGEPQPANRELEFKAGDKPAE